VFAESLITLNEMYEEESKSDPEFALSFSKDSDPCLDFITAVSNLRARVYAGAKIPLSSRWDIKEVAGNIIPAIASTNAIIAGLIVLDACKVLAKDVKAKNVFLVRPVAGRKQLLNIEELVKPNPACGVCSSIYVRVSCCVESTSIGVLVETVVRERLGLTGDLGVEEGGRLLLDPDFLDNEDISLKSMGVHGEGSRVTISVEAEDEGNEDHAVIVFVRHDGARKGVEIIGGERVVVKKAVKRKREEEAVVDEGQSKKVKKEEDSVVLIEDDDVILLD
jgi:ubiquitin-like 1-activating enzyme E1 B